MRHSLKSIIALLLCVVMLSTTILTSCDSGDSGGGGDQGTSQSTPSDNTGDNSSQNKPSDSKPDDSENPDSENETEDGDAGDSDGENETNNNGGGNDNEPEGGNASEGDGNGEEDDDSSTETPEVKDTVDQDTPYDESDFFDITLNKTEVSLVAGFCETLRVISDTEIDSDDITWITSDSTIVEVYNGKIIGLGATGGGIATVTATTKYGKSASCQVAVTLPYGELWAGPTASIMNKGDTAYFQGIIMTGDINRTVVWSSSDTSILRISPSGSLVTATALKAGYVEVTCSIKDTDISVTCVVGVMDGTGSSGQTPTAWESNSHLNQIPEPKFGTCTGLDSNGGTYTNVTKTQALNYVSKLEDIGFVFSSVVNTSDNYAATGKKGDLTVSIGWTNAQMFSVLLQGGDNSGSSGGSGSSGNGSAPTGITLSNVNVSINASESIKLTATTTPSGADITWTSSDTSIATVSSNGTVVGKKAGSAVITASTRNGYKAFCLVAVTAQPTSISVENNTITMSVGQKELLIPITSPAANVLNNAQFVYESSKTGVVRINEYGVMTAVGKGTAIVTIDAGLGAYTEITVTVTDRVNNVSFEETKQSIVKGSSQKLTPVFSSALSTDITMNWSSSNPSVAEVDANGNVTGKALGSAIITLELSNGKKAICSVIVVNSNVTLDKTDTFIALGNSGKLTATVKFDTLIDKTVRWSSSDETIATVDQNGNVTTHKAGVATITASIATGKSASCMVKVGTFGVSFSTLEQNGENISGTVSNAKNSFNFDDEITLTGDASYFISYDKNGTDNASSHTVALEDGDNIFYIIINTEDGTYKYATYTVTIRRKPMYAVKIETPTRDEYITQLVEEGKCVDISKIKYLGYTFSSDYDFSKPIMGAQTIGGTWTVADEMAAFEFKSTATTCIISGIKNKTVTSIVVPEYVTKIEFGAFSGCSKLESIALPFVGYSRATPSTKKMELFGYIFGSTAFEGGVETTVAYETSSYDYVTYKFYIPESLTHVMVGGSSIRSYAFMGCYTIQSLTIGSDVTSIGDSAFYLCDGLESITFGENSQLISIGEYAFGYCGLTSIALPDGAKTIEYMAFSCCYNLASVTISDSVTSIGACAFEYCSGLENVIYFGSAEKFGQISIGAGNQALTSANRIYTCLEHVENEAVIENYVDSTCKLEGSYDTVIYCSKCGSELERTTTIIQKKEHTSAEAVTENFVDSTCKVEGSYDSVIYCSGCGDELGRTKETVEKKTEHTLAEAVVENLVDSTCKVEGSYDSVVYCLSCKDEIDRTTVIIEKKAHAPSNAVIENLIDSTCKVKGSYDNVVYCSNCNEELERTTVTVEKKTHVPSKPVIENYMDSSCIVEGYYDSVIYCSNCSDVLSKTSHTITIKDTHNWDRENTCEDCGTYKDEGVTFTFNSTSSEYSVTDYSGSETSVIIPSTYKGYPVTSIGNYAFASCYALTSITIGNSVKSMGESAFYNCIGLTEINFNATMMNDLEYNNDVFYLAGDNASGIAVNIGSNVTRIPARLFYPRYNTGPKINSVSFADGTVCKSIGIYAFANGEDLTAVYISDLSAWCNISFENATSNPLYHAKKLYLNGELVTEIVIPDGVTNIENYVFYNCNGLTSVTIPDSVTTIGEEAFYACENLKSVNIGNGVTSIGSYAFYYCIGLTSVTIGDKVNNISNSAFRHCSGVTSITIPNSVTTIGDKAFYDCYRLVEVINKSSLSIDHYSSQNGYLGYYSIQIHSGESKIVNNGGYLFYSLYGMSYLIGYSGTDKDLILPTNYNGSTYRIHAYAFYNCSALTSITIPDSLSSIGKNAFDGCEDLTAVYISDLSAWCDIRFENYTSNPLYYAKNLYLNGELITELVVPDKVICVNNYAFYNCEPLTSIIISDNVTGIGDAAFASCTGLTQIMMGNSVRSIGKYAFQSCEKLTSIAIPNSVTSIYYGAFDYCNGLTSVYISDFVAWCNISFENVTSNPLYYAKNLYLNRELVTELVIPNGVTSIGDCSFVNCTSITSVRIPDGVTSIGDSAFNKCTGLTSVIIPNSVTKIGEYAFGYCNGLTNIYYCGVASDWGNINKDYAFWASSGNLFCYSESEPTDTTYNYWHYVDGLPTPWEKN